MICLTRYRRTFTIFADDNNLSTVGNTIDEAKAVLIAETEAAINWIELNQMIANPEKFHLMFLSANEKDLINQQTKASR